MATTKIRGNTQIIAGSITNAEINASANIELSKLAEAVLQADGGQTFTGDQNAGNFKITNLGTPTLAGDAVTKAYVDNLTLGLSWKDAVKYATTGPGTLATDFENGDIVDGQNIATGDRILIKDQVAPEENGIYVVQASGAPVRATDFDSWAKIPASAVFVEAGSTLNDSGWVCTSDAGGTLGTTAITFAQFTGAASITAGTGLQKSGNTINAVAADTSINMGADSFSVELNTTGGLETSTGVKLKLDATTDGYATIATSTDGARVVSVKNANIAADAGIVLSKLASGTSAQVIVANGSGVPSYVTMSGDATIATTGALTLSSSVIKEADIVTEEIPAGSINSSNVTFTLAATPVVGTVRLYLNGLRQLSGAGNDYTITGDTITFTTAPTTGDVLLADYFK